MISHAFGRDADVALYRVRFVSVPRFASILFIAAIVLGSADANLVHASCNLIPVATRQYPSTLGAVTSPVTAPGKAVELAITTCDGASPGFEPVASSNSVTLRFEPPGGGADTDIPIDSGTISVSDCVLPGGRCRSLTFGTPDTSAVVVPHGAAGPARILVRDGLNDLVAEIGELFLPTTGCDRQSEGVFQQFTVLPPANNYASAANGGITELLATVDGGGDLLIPFDYWGGGGIGNSVLAETPGSPVARLLIGSAEIPAMGAGDPNTIADVISAQPSPSSFVRSFTLDGRPLPPLLRANDAGGLFGSADAVESVLRIARDDGDGGPALYDLSDRLTSAGRGPVLIDNFTVSAANPIPLASLHSSDETVAFTRDENREGAFLNSDGDQDDFVVQVVDVRTGTSVNTTRADTKTGIQFGSSSINIWDYPPALAVEGELASFLESEQSQQATDLNLDGDTDDSILRVVENDGTSVTGLLAVDASTTPMVNGEPLVSSAGRVFFRSPNEVVEKIDDVGGNPLTGLSALTLSGDDAHLYVTSTDGEVLAYERDNGTGKLTLIDQEINGGPVSGLSGATGIVLSPDGENVYVASNVDDAVAVFSRDTGTGQLTFLESHFDDLGGVAGLGGARSVVVSSDGANVYVLGVDDLAIAAFDRGPGGTLTFVEAEPFSTPNLDVVGTMLISSDGKHVYLGGSTLAGMTSAPVMWTFERDSLSGELSLLSTLVRGGPTLAISADGAYVYSRFGADSRGFNRNSISGDLILRFNGGDGPIVNTATAAGLIVSPDGLRVYALQAFAAFADFVNRDTVSILPRDLVDGIVGNPFEQHVDGVGGVTGLTGSVGIAVSADGRHIYVAAGLAGAITVFRNDVALRVFDTDTASLRPQQPFAKAAAVGGGRALVSVPEYFAGQDLNLDGDMFDDVAALYDAAGVTDTVTNLELAVYGAVLSDTLVAFGVPEAQEQTDYDNDGDLSGSQLAVYEIGSPGPAVLTGVMGVPGAILGDAVFVMGDCNAGLFRYEHASGTATRIDEGATTIIAAAGSMIAYTRYEGDCPQPARDLNGDGDTIDNVLFIRDFETGRLINTRIASVGCLGSTCPPLVPYKIDAQRGTVSTMVFESQQSQDLDGDDDMTDVVLVVYDVRAKRAQTGGKSTDGSAVSLIDLPSFPQELGDGQVVYTKAVESQVDADLNGDGAITSAEAVVVRGDFDGDGALDDFDNCVNRTNAAQSDFDGDELGDRGCDPFSPICAPQPLVDCLGMLEPGKASLSIKNVDGSAKDSLMWKWSKGVDTNLGDFGDPLAGPQNYSLCVYDASPREQPWYNGVMMPASTLLPASCASEPCWKVSASSLKFNDKAASLTGVQKALLKAGTGGAAKLLVKAKGDAFDPPRLPLTPPVIAQFVVNHDDGSHVCWEATYTSFKKNGDETYKAKSD